MSMTDGSDRLSLGDCPGCGYALQGLPETGTCPECGRAYDNEVIVLHGWGRGARANMFNAVPGKVVRLAVPQLLVPLALAAIGAPPVIIVAIFGVSVAISGYILWKRSNTPLPAPVQVHLSSEGCVQLDNPSSRYNERVKPWHRIGVVRVQQISS